MLSKNKIDRLAPYVSEKIIPQYSKGFTMNPYTRVLPIFQEDQYIVALNGYEKRLFYPIEIGEVFSWLCANAHAFENRFIGGWHDSKTNEYVLDVSVVITGEQEAINFGLFHKQTHIYHQFLDEEIPIIERKAA